MKNIIIPYLFLFSALSISCEAQVKQNDVPLKEDSKNYKLETVVGSGDIPIPWGMVWLPDGTMLVTEKSGALYHIKNGTKLEIKNVPKVYTRGQGGLLDIALHPNYNKNGWIYMTFASDEGEGTGGHTKLIRAKLLDGSLTQVESLYKATPNTTKGQHF